MGGGTGPAQSRRWRAQLENGGIHQRFGPPGVCLRIRRLTFNGAIEPFETFRNAPQSRVQEEIALQERLVSLGIDFASRRWIGLVHGSQRGPDLGRNRSRNFTLQGEHIGEIALIFLRPEMPVVASADQLRRDAHLLTRLGYCSFYDCIRSEEHTSELQ